MSSLPPAPSSYLQSTTTTFVCLHFYMITFSSLTAFHSLDELNKGWHVIDNNLIQIRQVQSRSISFQETISPPSNQSAEGFRRSVVSGSLNPASLQSERITSAASWLPRVSTMKTTETKTEISMTPAWLDNIKVTSPVRYPPAVTATTDTALRRSFDTLAKYRAVRDGQYNQPIDFTAKPFAPDVNSTETLIVLLDTFAYSNGMKTTIAERSSTHEDSLYRAACGVVDLSTLPLLNVDDGPLSTATFNLKLNLSYEDVTSSENTIREFVVSFINDVSKKFECPPEYVRVFELTRGSLVTKWGFTTPDERYTQELAKKFIQQAQKPFSVELLVLSKAVPANHPISWEPVPCALQLHPSDFEPNFDKDYRKWSAHDSIQQRGGRSYYRPVGWYRHALRVLDKYGNDTSWLSMNNGPSEWAVAYHGTKKAAVSPIMTGELKPAQKDTHRSAAEQMKGHGAKNGIYLATHCNKGADANRYAGSFSVKMPSGIAVTEEKYKVVFQCRFNRDAYTEHRWTWTSEPYDPLAKEIRVYKMDGVRPYGILLKKVIQSTECNLTGVWTCDDKKRNVQDAGTYFVSQFGEKVFWFGRKHKASWDFANVGYGTINQTDHKLAIQWGDLPLGRNRFFGRLILQMSADYQTMTKTDGSDQIFAGTHFRRVSNEYLGSFDVDTNMKWQITTNDINGCWKGNDGTKYVISTSESQIYWLAIDEINRRSHIAVGIYNNTDMNLNWADIISGQEKFHGEIKCKKESANEISVQISNGSQFSSKKLTKVNLS